LPHKYYDLVIGDGDLCNLVEEIVQYTALIKQVFFEGKRFSLQRLFRKALAKKYILTSYKYYCPSWQGKTGYKITCRPSDNKLLRVSKNQLNELCCKIEFLKVFIRKNGTREGSKELIKRFLK